MARSSTTQRSRRGTTDAAAASAAVKPSPRKRAVARAPGPPGVQLGEFAGRAMILQAAAMVFAERGVRAASVEDLLKASGISRRTFYRLYQGKEDVMLAIYSMGTDLLIESCRRAIAEETTPVRKLRKCIDSHLANVRGMGRLLFVLHGEAHHEDSSLYARRMQAHATLVDMLAAGTALARSEERIDPLLFRALLLALEQIVRTMLAEGDEGRSVTEASIERARRVMYRLGTATLVGSGPGVTPMPLME
jgi:AcrR family transcriptional regulator